MTIGARVLKTGFAVALAIFVSSLAGFSSPIIAAVAAIFTIQPTIYRSWQQLLEQLQANVIGAALALGAVQVLGSRPIAVGLVCVAVILINIRLRIESAIGLTLVTVVAVMESNTGGWEFAADRLAQILTGIGSAFLVNVLIAPPRPHRQFNEQVRSAYEQLSLLLRTAISNEIKENVHKEGKDRLHATLRKLDERFGHFEEEKFFSLRSKLKRARQLVVSKQHIKALQKGADLLDVVEEHYFSTPGAEDWAGRFDARIEELTRYHEHILLKFEGKIKPEADIEPDGEPETKFAQQLTAYLDGSVSEHRGLIFVASSLFEYAYQLKRLDKLVDRMAAREE